MKANVQVIFEVPSLCGISEVISHIMEDGEKKSIPYTSYILRVAKKKNYAPIEKEDLAVVNRIKKFHQELYDQHFTIVTDHKPTLRLLYEMKAIPTLVSQWIQRKAVTLSAYEYTLQY